MPPNDPGIPFEGLLADLLKMLQSQSQSPQGFGASWFDSARALALNVANDGGEETNPDPIDRIRFEPLARLANFHVKEVTGLTTRHATIDPTFIPVGRGTWAVQALDAWRSALEKIVGAPRPIILNANPDPDPDAGTGTGTGTGTDTGTGDLPEAAGFSGSGPAGTTLGDLIGSLASAIGPAILGMQFGSAIGHLATHSLGAYALPISRRHTATSGALAQDELPVVAENITAFAQDWSLPLDQVELWICIHDLTAHGVLSVPHVADRLDVLLGQLAADSAHAQNDLMTHLSNSAGPDMLQDLLQNPTSLFSTMAENPNVTTRTSADLIALTCVIEAYVDHITAQVATSLIGTPAPLIEAWRRRRDADDSGTRAAGALFGLDLGRDAQERGATFIRGVIEHAGDDELRRLFSDPRTLPTPAEIDAPGLWLARIDLPDDTEPNTADPA